MLPTGLWTVAIFSSRICTRLAHLCLDHPSLHIASRYMLLQPYPPACSPSVFSISPYCFMNLYPQTVYVAHHINDFDTATVAILYFHQQEPQRAGRQSLSHLVSIAS